MLDVEIMRNSHVDRDVEIDRDTCYYCVCNWSTVMQEFPVRDEYSTRD